MKRTGSFILSLAAMAALVFNSCSEEGYTDPIEEPAKVDELPWNLTTQLSFNAEAEKQSFVWQRNVVSLEESWQNTEVEFDVQIQSFSPVSQIQKIEFYITAEEKEGYNYSEPFDTEGKMIATVTSWDDLGQFTLTLNATEVYPLFESNFEYDRSEKQGREGDIFELHWVITGKDGKVLDSRNSVSGDSRYGFQTKVVNFAPPVFEGDFTLEWTSATMMLEVLSASYTPVVVGSPKTITITSLGDGQYTLGAIAFDAPISLSFDYESGLLATTSAYSEVFTVTAVEGPTLTIDYSMVLSAAYNIYGTFTLTRTDGGNWPENVHSN